MIFGVEIACFSLQAVQLAQQFGADRVEFCADKSAGGITPPRAEIIQAKKFFDIPLFVMIRPHGGDFIYDNSAYQQMISDIDFCKKLNIDGIVLGILTERNSIDFAKNELLVQRAFPMACTFHRAFDIVPDKEFALRQLIKIGFKNVLTSGGEGNAARHIAQLENLIQLADNEINIIVGGGIRSVNVKSIVQKTNARWIHSAATIKDELPDIGELQKLLNLRTQPC